MAILILDGFVYFAVVFGAFLANMLIWALASVSPPNPPRIGVIDSRSYQPALAELPHQ